MRGASFTPSRAAPRPGFVGQGAIAGGDAGLGRPEHRVLHHDAAQQRVRHHLKVNVARPHVLGRRVPQFRRRHLGDGQRCRCGGQQLLAHGEGPHGHAVFARGQRRHVRAHLVDDAVIGHGVGAKPHSGGRLQQHGQCGIGDEPHRDPGGSERGGHGAAFEARAALGQQHARPPPEFVQVHERSQHGVAGRQRGDERVVLANQPGSQPGGGERRGGQVRAFGLARAQQRIARLQR